MGEPELILLSALQHYLYCPRQCALIHVERQWTENQFTAEGQLLHQRTDLSSGERRHGVRTVTALPIANERLGITGVADVVEFHDGRPYPVEYKRGRPKSHRADEVQLCAQAMCLEAMFDTTVPEGALFYGRTRRRQIVVFDDALRGLVIDVITSVREMIEHGITPPPEYQSKRCDSCSLIELCQPKRLEKAINVDAWLARQLKD